MALMNSPIFVSHGFAIIVKYFSFLVSQCFDFPLIFEIVKIFIYFHFQSLKKFHNQVFILFLFAVKFILQIDSQYSQYIQYFQSLFAFFLPNYILKVILIAYF